MRSGKRHMREGIELLNQEKIRILEEKETYKYLETLRANTIKQMKMKKKNLSVFQENEETTGYKLYRRYLIKWINTWTVPL